MEAAVAVAKSAGASRIHQLHLCRGVRPLSNKTPGYDIKQSDGEVPVMLELWGILSTSSLALPPVPLCPGSGSKYLIGSYLWVK